MHRGKLGGVPGVDWGQLRDKCPSISGRLEHFQYCLSTLQCSYCQGVVEAWCKLFFAVLEFFLIFDFKLLPKKIFSCQGAI